MIVRQTQPSLENGNISWLELVGGDMGRRQPTRRSAALPNEPHRWAGSLKASAGLFGLIRLSGLQSVICGEAMIAGAGWKS